MKHYLLNHQPQKGLQTACAEQGQAPTCNARGKGHTPASPKTLTRILLVLLTMFLLPSAAWGQDPAISVFYDDGLYFVSDLTVKYKWNNEGEETEFVGDNKIPVQAGTLTYWAEGVDPVSITYYGLIIGNTPLTNLNVDENGAVSDFEELKNGSVSYAKNEDSAILSLVNADIDSYAHSGIIWKSDESLSIQFSGTNYIKTGPNEDTNPDAGFNILGNSSSLTLTGLDNSSTLTLKPANGYRAAISGFTSVSLNEGWGMYYTDNYTVVNPNTSPTAGKEVILSKGQPLGLSVAGVVVTSENKENILGDQNSSVSFTTANEATSTPATLTLNNAAITGDIVWNPSENTDLTINLSGNNTLTGTISTKENISSTVETNLSFTGSTDCSLEITKESGSVISGNFKTVNFGNFNLATSSPGAYWDGERMADYSGSEVTNLKITSEVYYPIWVMHRTPEHTQLTSEVTQVDMVKKIDNTDVVICTVSYDTTNGKLTIKANEAAGDNAFQPGGSNAAIVVGPSMEELKVHLKGKTKITDYGSFVFSIWDTTSLIFTTDETSPGSLTGTKIVDWKSKNSGGTGQITYENGLVFNYDSSSTYTETISTTGTRIKIGEGGSETVISASTDENGLFNGTVFFDASNNTLKLKGATLGNIDSYGIKVFVDDLKVVISGENTILGDITYSGNSGQSSFIKINKAEEATSASLTMKNIEQFGACTWGDGLYLSANNSVDVRYEFENGEGAFRSYYGEISTVTISTNRSYPLWINGIQATEGSVTGTGIAKNGESVSEWGITFIPATNTLKLQNVLLSTSKDQTPAIISGLDNLNIQIEGNNNVSNTGSYGGYTALSTKSNAVLTITTEDDGQLNTTNGSSSYSANPFHGFQSVTFNGDLIYIGGTGCQYIRNLGDPGISLSSENKLKLSSSHDDYGSHYVSYYYTLDFADSDENDISTPTLLSKDEEGPTIAEACTITAYISYEYKGNEYKDYEYGTLKKTGENNPAIGKYFAIADKTIVFSQDAVLSADEIKLKLIPAVADGDGVTFDNAESENTAVIQLSGTNYQVKGLGTTTMSANLVINDAPFKILNEVATGNVTVVPPAPTIVKDTKKDYLTTDLIEITQEEFDDFETTISYTWDEATAESPVWNTYPEDEDGVPAQTGTLRARVEYSAGKVESAEAKENFAVKINLATAFVSGLENESYTGSAIVPTFTLKESETATTEISNANYDLSYEKKDETSGNFSTIESIIEVGTYKITATGKGDSYGGSLIISDEFKVIQAENAITKEPVSVEYPKYTGELMDLIVAGEATFGDIEYKIGEDGTYSTDIPQASAVGNYTIYYKVEGTENYSGCEEQSLTVSIDKGSFVDDLEITIEGWTYGNEPNEPVLTGKLGEGAVTWKYKYPNSENFVEEAPTATSPAGAYAVQAIVAETDNYYAGSTDAEFTIEQATIDGITLEQTELTYNGKEQSVKVKKVMAGDIEVAADYYEISGNRSGTEAGNYTLIVTAKLNNSDGSDFKNNFKGSAEKDWKIKNRTVTTDELGLSENQSQATYYSETEDLEVPEGVVAYIITGVNGNNVVTQRIRYIPKRVAVFVEQTTSTENPLEVIPDASELPLKGTAVDLNVASISGGTVYVLYKGEFVKSTTGTIPAKRCYLLLPNNVAAGTRAFGIIGGGSDGSTAIKSINDEPSTIDNWYDMGGHRIEKPTKTGIYIKNGKKVAIK